VIPDFLETYEEHVSDVYGFFVYRVGSPGDAEDLTQQTFEQALRAWERFDPDRAGARTWLMTIARNLLIDHYRRDRTGEHNPVEDADAKGRLGVVDPPEARLGVEPELGAALARLSERERELIALRFGGELTGPEISELTGLTLANVQQILSRSLRRLRAELEDRESRRI
jgi:RNA polymerase sigma factor (sigma-70 family)